MVKGRSLAVQGIEIGVSDINGDDYISLTDMVKGFEDGTELIKRWLQNRATIEFLGVWEQINNENFNLVEFHQIKNNVGSNSYIFSIKKWMETGAIGIQAKAGRYGGTYAHKDIAFEFGSWISPEFKLYLIKEFQRLKELEARQTSIEWQVKRELAKVNYRVHTDSIQQHLIPTLPKSQHQWVYSSEADMLNAIVFGRTAKEWRSSNPNADGNQRDHGTALDNAIIANLEVLNSLLIQQGLSMEDRFGQLRIAAENFRSSMEKSPAMQRLNDQAQPLLSHHDKEN